GTRRTEPKRLEHDWATLALELQALQKHPRTKGLVARRPTQTRDLPKRTRTLLGESDVSVHRCHRAVEDDCSLGEPLDATAALHAETLTLNRRFATTAIELRRAGRGE